MDREYTLVTLEERPDLEDEINKLHYIGWINFNQFIDQYGHFCYAYDDLIGHLWILADRRP